LSRALRGAINAINASSGAFEREVMPSQSPHRTGAAITVRGLTTELKARLRIRAAHNARSMEAEARAILEKALSRSEEDAVDLGTYAQRLFRPLGGVELELPPRELAREPPDFRVDKRQRRRSRR
jgi:plasmid stability protein